MKKLAFLLLFCTISVHAQQGINYKAQINDASGSILANQNVTLEFTVLEGVAQTNVYQETHSTTTDANGLVILSIGTGTTTDTFSDINWNNFNHSLQVRADTGAGFVNLGTSQFNAVPYALAVANSGLEAVEEGASYGWRLIGLPDENYGPIGDLALDFSRNNALSGTIGATGNLSAAIGYKSTASGINSVSAGPESTASGNSSFTAGNNTVASGNNSTAFGRQTTASGIFATAMGEGTKAESVQSTAIGKYNIGGGDPQNINGTDPLFEVGNGTSDTNRSNALTILKNGTITAPEFDIAEITDNKALITKEYADSNFSGSGLEQLDEGNGDGWRQIVSI